MKKTVITLLLFFLSQLINAQVGTWKNYLSYHDIQQIQAAGDDIFVLASNGLYQYNQTDQSITTYDKTNGLSDTNITHIAWNKTAKRLIAVYSNANIDLVETNGNITNISDLHLKAITGDKTVNAITIDGKYAYLACGFGIVKLNIKDAEVSESYMFNHNVDRVAVSNGYVYAQLTDTKTTLIKETPVIPYHGNINLDSLLQARYKTETVVYYAKAPLNTNLIDKSNWELIFENLSSLFITDNTDYDKYIETVKTLQPGGPENNYFYYLKYFNDKLYTCGGVYEPLIDLNRPGFVQTYDIKNSQWTIYDARLDTITNYAYLDINCVEVDPNDDKHVFASGRTGLYEFYDGKFKKAYNIDNSELKSTFRSSPDKTYVIVTALMCDQESNLWLIQSLNRDNKLMILNHDGTWTKKDFNLFNAYGNTLGPNNTLGNAQNLYLDSKGYIWFVHNHYDTPAIYRYDNSNNTSKEYINFINQDGTTMDIDWGVRCLAEDLEGNIWIGTSNGVLMLEPTQMESENPIFTQVKVPRNDGTNYADYLLNNIDILDIAIDGAGRKWFATNGNGVYLISADNMEQIHHFTTENSKLLSNIVQSLAINNTSGEVFFGTDLGLCSFMSDATETNEEMNTDNVWAYPNPVNPDYTGFITITGLSYNADVKIVAPNGALINEGRSNGGTYVWNGLDRSGKRVASGIYMVVTATNSGQKGTVCKIAIIR